MSYPDSVMKRKFPYPGKRVVRALTNTNKVLITGHNMPDFFSRPDEEDMYLDFMSAVRFGVDEGVDRPIKLLKTHISVKNTPKKIESYLLTEILMGAIVNQVEWRYV